MPVARNGSQAGGGAPTDTGQRGAKAPGRGRSVYPVEQIRGLTSWSFLIVGDRFADADDIYPPMTGLAADPLGTPFGGPIRLMRRHFLSFLPVIFE
jgi:hypothetical protein